MPRAPDPGEGQLPLGLHSPAMNLIVLTRGRTRKQNLHHRRERGAPRTRPCLPRTLLSKALLGHQQVPRRHVLSWERHARLRAASAPGHSLVAGAGGRPGLHLVQLVHVVLLRGQGAGSAAAAGAAAPDPFEEKLIRVTGAGGAVVSFSFHRGFFSHTHVVRAVCAEGCGGFLRCCVCRSLRCWCGSRMKKEVLGKDDF